MGRCINKLKRVVRAGTQRIGSGKGFERNHRLVAVCRDELEWEGVAHDRIGVARGQRQKSHRYQVYAELESIVARAGETDMISLPGSDGKPEFVLHSVRSTGKSSE